MKIIVSKKAKCLSGIIAGVCLLLIALFNMIGYLFDCKYISVFAAMAEVDKYEVRSQLLMEAMDQVGVCIPEEAAEVWANGLKTRSAALQYSVMDKELKTEYAKRWEENAPNWVTGVSSPWVTSYQIVRIDAPEEDSRIIKLIFSTETSTGPAGDYNAILSVIREGDFWRITEISADKGLYPYTGF